MTLVLNHVNKIYSNKKQAITDLSFTIETGIIGLLGPNGAGKSSLMKLISTISKPSSGEIIYNGVNTFTNPNEIRKEIGYLPQEFGVYDNLNAFEFLTYIGALKGIDRKELKNRIYYFLDAFNLMDVAKRPISTYSGGMKQRIGIAQALLNDPKIILLDEPTVGLDPEERVRFRQLISEMSDERIILLSSHIVSDIEFIANKVAIMNNGQLLSYGTKEDVIQPIQNKIGTAIMSFSHLESFKNKFTLIDSLRQGDKWNVRFFINETEPTIPYKSSPASLEDAYLFQTKVGKHVA